MTISIKRPRSSIPRLFVGPLLPILCVLIFQGTRGPAPFDDSYITYRYARNICEGKGFVYNEGEAVLGTTTPLFTLVLAASCRLFGAETIPSISYWISLLADVLNVCLIYRLAFWVFNRQEIAIVASLGFAIHPFRSDVATGGMETSLFITFLLLIYVKVLIDHELYSSSLVTALAVLTRPDAVIALAPLFAWMLIWESKSAWRFAALAALIIAPWIIWATLRFGTPIPHSIIAKATMYKAPAGYAAFFMLTFIGTGTLGPYYDLMPVLASAIVALIMFAVGISFVVKYRPPALAVTLYPLLYMVVMILVNAEAYVPWYYPPLIPGLLFAYISSVWYLPKLRVQARIGLAALFAIILVATPGVLLSIYPGWTISRERLVAYDQACEVLKLEVKPNDTVLAPDIGIIGWCLQDVTIIDPIGLVSPIALQYASSLRPGEVVSPALIQDTRPDFVVALDQYLQPYVANSPEFASSYTLLWQQEVSIAGISQPLYIFRHT